MSSSPRNMMYYEDFMGYPWAAHGLSTDHLRTIHGLPMGYIWATHGLPPWFTHGLPVGARGQPMGDPRVPT